MDLTFILFFIPVAVFSITLHEWAHAWVAKREGDDTAESLGRLTMNPIPHIDPIGTILLPIGMFYFTGFLFGWARPVPVNPSNYRNPIAGDIRVSLAGIVVNLVLAVLATAGVAMLVRLRGSADSASTVEILRVAQQALEFGIVLNLVLAVFNLMPVPPLDGSHVAKYLLPEGLRQSYEGLGRYSMLFIGLIFFFPRFGAMIFSPVWFLQDLAYRLIAMWS
jgi:Zn-dependent protease